MYYTLQYLAMQLSDFQTLPRVFQATAAWLSLSRPNKELMIAKATLNKVSFFVICLLISTKIKRGRNGSPVAISSEANQRRSRSKAFSLEMSDYRFSSLTKLRTNQKTKHLSLVGISFSSSINNLKNVGPSCTYKLCRFYSHALIQGRIELTETTQMHYGRWFERTEINLIHLK